MTKRDKLRLKDRKLNIFMNKGKFKVKCIDNYFMEDYLTIGKEYRALKGYYKGHIGLV